jgi:hypothetical protein
LEDEAYRPMPEAGDRRIVQGSSAPSISTRPSVGVSMQPIILGIVDFPDSRGPAMEMKSPLAISKLNALHRVHQRLAGGYGLLYVCEPYDRHGFVVSLHRKDTRRREGGTLTGHEGPITFC